MDNEFGIATVYHQDDVTGDVMIERIQDVEGYIEACKVEKNLGKWEKRTDFFSRHGKKVMSIPNVIAEKFNVETNGQFFKWRARDKA
ncbi:MAG: hypothetical protein ACR2RE_14255, partial [Geminicoccaceae bacterium]